MNQRRGCQEAHLSSCANRVVQRTVVWFETPVSDSRCEAAHRLLTHCDSLTFLPLLYLIFSFFSFLPLLAYLSASQLFIVFVIVWNSIKCFLTVLPSCSVLKSATTDSI